MPCPARRTVLTAWSVMLVTAVLATALAAQAAPTQTDTYALVRYWLDSPADEAFLRAHPNLDIVYVKPGVHADIVAREKELDDLRASGARIDIVHSDLKAHYLSRIGPEKSNSFGIYHNWQEVVAFVDSLRLLYPQVVSEKWSLGQSHEGRDIWCFRMSNTPDVDKPDRPEILFDALHQARAVMTSEFDIMFAEYLAQNYGSDPEITYLLDTREVYFVPVVNPDGFWFNNWGDMWRKNRRDNGGSPCWGVAPNRNYPFQWVGPGSSTDPCDDTYRGPLAGSEPEIQAIMGLINSHQFVTRNSIHSSGNMTLYPWSYTENPTPDDAIFEHMGQMMTMFNGYTPGQPPELLYVVNGGSIDWDYGATGEHAKIFGFTNEIGGGSDGFWPAESRRGELFQENIWPAIYLMRGASAFVAASDPVVLGGNGNGRLDPGESANLSFTLENQGISVAAENVTVTLSSDDPYLQLGEAYRDVGTITPLGTLSFAGDPFQMSVDPACPVGRIIHITATVTQQDGSHAYDFPFLVGPPAIVFSDAFSQSSGAWTFTGSWDLTSTQFHSPPSCLTDSPSGDYPDQSSTSATLNDGYFATHLSFWHRYAIESGWDYGYVQVSADGGPWESIATYTGNLTAWTQVELDLSAYAGQSVRIRFQLVSDTWITEDGWYIDDVALYGSQLVNEAPPAPALITPTSGEVVGSEPLLTVANSYDPDGPGTVTYGVRVYGDELCTDLVAFTDGIPEGTDQTEWSVPTLSEGSYYWRAFAADPTESGLMGEKRSFAVQSTTGVGDTRILGPRLAVLGPVSSDHVRMQLELPAATDVTLNIYDARGHLVRRLYTGPAQAGARVLSWDGRDSNGRSVASGVYFVQLQTEQQSLSEKVVVVR